MSAPAADLFDTRARELSQLGARGWYADHVGHSRTCGCNLAASDRACDLGEALFRLSRSAREDEKQRKRA